MALISISRQIATPGNEIAERIAHNLGYVLVTGVDIDSLIVQYGFPEDKMKFYNEKRPHFFHSLLKEKEIYINYLRLAVLNMAKKNNVVFIGKGSFKILDGIDNHVSINITSPLEKRVERMSRERNINIHHAGVSILKRDARRKGYYKDFFKTNIDDSNQFNLTITATEEKSSIIADMLSAMIKNYDNPENMEKSRKKLDSLLVNQSIINMLVIENKLPISNLSIKNEGKTLMLNGLAENSAIVDRATTLINLEYPDYKVFSKIRCVQDFH